MDSRLTHGQNLHAEREFFRAQDARLVYAFQPRKIDPPHFVAETEDDLNLRVGELVSAEQCDACGNSCYEITRVGYGSPKPIRGFSARCVDDPNHDQVEAGFTGCGRGYPIIRHDSEEVVF